MKPKFQLIVLSACILFCACGKKQEESKIVMNSYQQKTVKDLIYSVPDLIGNGWMLITAGTAEDFNTMTASWGQIGQLWGKNVATVYIRPQRYTHDFVEREEVFTLSFFGEQYRKALNICGTKSGRDCDKVSEAGLTPVVTPSNSVAFEQAYLILECRKLYAQDLTPEGFTDKALCAQIYPQQDYHTMYVGEIIGVYMK